MGVGVAALLAPFGAAAQLPIPDAGALALGDMIAATARGFVAVGGNPAGLAWVDGPSTSLTLLPIRAGSGMGPVGFGDLAEWEGRDVPRSVREGWLRTIEARGREEGAGVAHATAVAGSVGRLGFQLSTVAVARGRLNPDASELLLFGNAGRTGTPRTFELDGSRMDAAVFTAAALAYGLPVDEMAGGRLAAGATVTFTVGHALVAGRDAGSSLGADPVLVDVRFPLLTPRTPRGNDHASTGGTGVGLDLGARWLRGRVELGATFRNVVNTFAWRLDRLAFRPGTALFDQELSETDFEPRPGVEAPAVLREAADGLGFAREVELGAAWRVHDDVEIVGGVRRRLTEGLPLAPRTQAAGGVRTRLTDRVELAGHLGASERGAGIGAGATVLLGAFRISGAGAWGTGVVDAGSTWSLSASWEG